MIKKRNFPYILLGLIIFLVALQAKATPIKIEQTLSQTASRINFGVDSPNPGMRMSGSFREFKGILSLDPNEFTRSNISFTLDPTSFQLPPEQLMQTLLVQSLLARVSPGPRTFHSSTIERIEGNSYLLNGSYDWLKSRKKVSIPITFDRKSQSRSEIRFAINGSFERRNVPSQLSQLAKGAAGSSGWTKAVLVFAAEKSA